MSPKSLHAVAVGRFEWSVLVLYTEEEDDFFFGGGYRVTALDRG